MALGIDLVDVYYRLPVLGQNAVCCAYGLKEKRKRMGKTFHRKLDWLCKSEWWSKDHIQEYQENQLRKLVTYAYQNVPYYRRVMREIGISPEDIKTRADLKKMPILTKEILRRHSSELISDCADRAALLSSNSSGTTGKAVHFFVSQAALAFQWAIWWRLRHRFGIKYGQWHVNFSGRPVIPPWQTDPPFWRWNFPMKQMLVNMQQLNVSKIAAVTGFLNDHPVEFFVGYPSFMHSFVLAAREAGVSLSKPPRVIFTGAEGTLDEQRRDIEAFTGAKLTDHYGFSEGCGNASRCEAGVYHEDFEFGILECAVPSEPDEKGNVKGSILATGFACREFPFIRYEVGDMGVWAPSDKDCSCGRNSPVLPSIEGRLEDCVITPEGNRIMRFDYIFKDTLNVSEAQVLQEKMGEIVVRVIPRAEYSGRDEEFMRSEIARWISPELEVHFERVSQIEREPNGKFRAVKSLLERGQRQ